MRTLKSFGLLIFLLIHKDVFTQSCCCTGAGANYSILPNLNKNVMGMRWTYSSLYSKRISLNQELNGIRTNIFFHTAEIFGRFNLTKRWQISAFVPVNFISETSKFSHQRTTGLGDISMLVQYLAFDPLRCNGSKSKHQLRLGGGFKLPSGRHEKEDNNLYSTSMQPGTGSTDFFFNAIYTYRYNSFGLNISSSYRVNTANSYQFRFGDKLEGAANVFYLIKSGGWTFMPNFGIRYLHSFQNFHRGKMVYSSNSDIFSTCFSFDLYYRRLAFNISALPVAFNQVGVGDVNRTLTLESGLFYNF